MPASIGRTRQIEKLSKNDHEKIESLMNEILNIIGIQETFTLTENKFKQMRVEIFEKDEDEDKDKGDSLYFDIQGTITKEN